MANEEYLTTAEAAKLLKVSRGTVCMLAREGRLPAIRVGKQWRIPHEAPELWIYKQKQTAARNKATAKIRRRETSQTLRATMILLEDCRADKIAQQQLNVLKCIDTTLLLAAT